MNNLILSTKLIPIEIALDIDSTGHTTAKKLYEWLECIRIFMIPPT